MIDLEDQVDAKGVVKDSSNHLVSSMHSLPPPPPPAPELNDSNLDLNTAIRYLEEERRKNEKLRQMYINAKEQLEEAQQNNESLTNDLQKITNEWESLREELLVKEDEWRDEEHAFNEYYTAEHSRMLMLWRNVVCVKRTFAEVQMNTERDLNKLKQEYANMLRDFSRTCQDLKTMEAQSALSEVSHFLK